MMCVTDGCSDIHVAENHEINETNYTDLRN